MDICYVFWYLIAKYKSEEIRLPSFLKKLKEVQVDVN